MLRQPQLHNSIWDSHACVCTSLPPEPNTAQRFTHIFAHNKKQQQQQITILSVVATGDTGASIKVWLSLSQVVQENDDSWQLTGRGPPQKYAPSPFIPTVIPPILTFSSFTSHTQSFLSLSHAGWWSNNSCCGTCLDSLTLLIITRWAACLHIMPF